MPADVADVLYGHLKLPVPPGCQKGKQHASTDKHALDFLRELHPIAEVIKEHRSLSKIFQSTIGAILSRAKPSVCSNNTNFDVFHIYGHWLQTSTATGRVFMEDPNLQCVEHSIHFSIEDHAETKKLKEVYVNARECFVPTEGDWVLLSADYFQIEVRMMAHFLGDPRLIELLRKPTGYLFRMIASVWSGQNEDTVTDKLREQTKRMIYGILYGMGINALAERLECSVFEASKNYDQFKAAFPGVSSWLLQAVESCRQRGYIKTIAGRKRYLDKINNSNRGEQAKAERQAVNSIGQEASDVGSEISSLHGNMAAVWKLLGDLRPCIRCKMPLQFAVMYEARANNGLDRMNMIDDVAKLIPKPHSVDLKTPDKTIIVQVMKTCCAIGVVRGVVRGFK